MNEIQNFPLDALTHTTTKSSRTQSQTHCCVGKFLSGISKSLAHKRIFTNTLTIRGKWKNERIFPCSIFINQTLIPECLKAKKNINKSLFIIILTISGNNNEFQSLGNAELEMRLFFLPPPLLIINAHTSSVFMYVTRYFFLASMPPWGKRKKV